MARVKRRYSTQMECVSASQVQKCDWHVCWSALCQTGLAQPCALRVLRQLAVLRLIELDCTGQVGLDVVMRVMSDLAAFSLDAALAGAQADAALLYGLPIGENSATAQMWIVGMGKLGARELNVSSDIDLIYVYDLDGETAGAQLAPISNHEFFAKVVRGIQHWLADVTEHGLVFRVDLALRPNGNSGPVACSLASLQEYFTVQGREWERFAWLKSRVVAPLSSISGGSAHALRSAVLPFVFRRYLDYNAFESLRDLHKQIREHAAKRAAGHPERANDVKLSRGGIREIEFTVQLLQVVRGGQFPELRTRPTLAGLERISRAGLMPEGAALGLGRAYVFLRSLEHRIQYLDDQQTHVLPTDDADLLWIARSLGYPTVCPLLHDLDAHREWVATEFNKLLGAGAQEPCRTGGCGGPGSGADKSGPSGLLELGHRQLKSLALAERVRALSDGPKVQALRGASLQRLSGLIARTDRWVDSDSVTSTGATRSIDWIEPLLRRESYLALLWEQPQVHQRLIKLLGTARWPTRYLMQHPGVIDELASEQWLKGRFDATVFEADLELRNTSLRITGEDTEESLMGVLRRAHHAEVFKTLARDVEGVLTVEQVADDLSAMADTVLAISLRWVWQRMKARHCDDAQCAVVAYGKLGGKELGYGSDLDIVFLYDDPHEKAGENYALLVRKLITWLTTKTAQGDLYEIDTALRPNGSSGLLVTSIAAFENYQTGQGSNAAWTWEHQAITRARVVLGPEALARRFDAVRSAVLCRPRKLPVLRAEISGMRRRVLKAHRVPVNAFDVKHSPGGMVDVEFMVQFLLLGYSHQCAALLDNVGNIALLRRAQDAGLIPSGLGYTSADAYRTLRGIQHRCRLDEAATHISTQDAAELQTSVLALWAALGLTAVE